MVANIVTSYNDAEAEIVSSSRVGWCSTIAEKVGVVGSTSDGRCTSDVLGVPFELIHVTSDWMR